MYPNQYAQTHKDRPAFIMASSGEVVTYGEMEARANRLAHVFRSQGLRRLDHYAVFMENNARYIECCAAGERSGLYYTCINSFLTAEELAFIINNSESKILITSRAKLAVAKAALADCPNVELCLIVDGEGDGSVYQNLDDATAPFPATAIADEWIGTSMLYSSGTTGQPKGILRPLPEEPPSHEMPVFQFLKQLWEYREGMIYLSPAPLYHSAPQAAVSSTFRVGGTVIIMEKFDPEHYLQLVEKYKVTHSQLVPTMFSRLLKLPDSVRSHYDLSTFETIVHAAAPCPVPVKERMIEWWGPIIHEYYGATEALGFTSCNSEEWLRNKGTVGQIKLGVLHILDDDMKRCPTGTLGTMWFETATPFEYFNNEDKTNDARSSDGNMTTVGDIGYLNEAGFLFLTDRKTFMIISGGVNIYPQECENLLISHSKVADAAVFGVPNVDLGEEVKAVVQAMPGVVADDRFVDELMIHCRDHLAKMKCPRSIDFIEEMPRLPTGKLYKTGLRDSYWGDQKSRIV